MEAVNPNIINYISEHILPIYDSFDKGHDREHAENVIKTSIELSRGYPVNRDMVYAIAAYHDIGIMNGREKHHVFSAEYVKKDEKLTEWFDNEQIDVISDAVYDHRASGENPPRTIYGKIVSDADREIDAGRVIYRVLQFIRASCPDYSLKRQLDIAYDHIKKKYGDRGYMKLWLPCESSEKKLDELRGLINNRHRFDEKFYRDVEPLLNI